MLSSRYCSGSLTGDIKASSSEWGQEQERAFCFLGDPGINQALLTITSSDPLGEFAISVTVALSSEMLEVLDLKKGTFLPEDKIGISLIYKPQLSPRHFRLLVPRDQKTRGKLSLWKRCLNPNARWR